MYDMGYYYKYTQVDENKTIIGLKCTSSVAPTASFKDENKTIIGLKSFKVDGLSLKYAWWK